MRRWTSALAAALLALTPALVFAHEGTEVSIRGEVRPGGPIEVTGEGFAPNDHVRIELRREGIEPVEIGRVPADAEGAFAQTLHVPEDVVPGLYRLAAEGEESATTDVTIVEPAEGEAPIEPEPEPTQAVSNDRPAGEIIALAVFTAAIAFAAAGLLWLSRTRPRRAGA